MIPIIEATPAARVTPPLPAQPTLDMQALSHHYGEVVTLQRVELQLYPGELVALVGPSGSGKTTLLAIAGGLLRPSRGLCHIAGQDLYGPKGARPEVARQAAYILQAAATIPFLTVTENLLVRTVLVGQRVTKAQRALAQDLLARVDLAAKARRLPNQLSAGERQRVCVAAALYTQAPLILADEPTASLDRRRGRAVMELLAAHAQQQRASVLVATHDERSLDLAHRVITIEDGVLT